MIVLMYTILNILDLVTTAIGLSLGCVEIGWYRWVGLTSFWQIFPVKILVSVLCLFLAYRWHFMKCIKWVNIGLVCVCLFNIMSILIMT
jgi:hypothetical protein